MATKSEAHASQTAYFRAESSVGSEVRHVVTISQFFRPFALLGLLAEAALEVSGHLPGRALVPRRIHGIRSRGSQKWWLVPRVYPWRGLLEEVRLEKHNVPKAHVRPHECRHSYQEVVALCSGFSRGEAEL